LLHILYLMFLTLCFSHLNIQCSWEMFFKVLVGISVADLSQKASQSHHCVLWNIKLNHCVLSLLLLAILDFMNPKASILCFERLWHCSLFYF
jgi:hypothetical protein